MSNNYKFRQRPARKNIRYTYHSYGTHFSFNPYYTTEDDRIVNEANEFEKLSMLDLYKCEVRMAKKAGLKHVYILNEKGKEVRV